MISKRHSADSLPPSIKRLWLKELRAWHEWNTAMISSPPQQAMNPDRGNGAKHQRTQRQRSQHQGSPRKTILDDWTAEDWRDCALGLATRARVSADLIGQLITELERYDEFSLGPDGEDLPMAIEPLGNITFTGAADRTCLASVQLIADSIQRQADLLDLHTGSVHMDEPERLSLGIKTVQLGAQLIRSLCTEPDIRPDHGEAEENENAKQYDERKQASEQPEGGS